MKVKHENGKIYESGKEFSIEALKTWIRNGFATEVKPKPKPKARVKKPTKKG